MLNSLLCYRRSTAHILIGRISARTNQTDFQLCWPIVLDDSGFEFTQWRSKIRGKRPVNVRFEFRQIDLNELIIFSALISTEVVSKGFRCCGDFTTTSSTEVVTHTSV